MCNQRYLENKGFCFAVLDNYCDAYDFDKYYLPDLRRRINDHDRETNSGSDDLPNLRWSDNGNYSETDSDSDDD